MSILVPDLVMGQIQIACPLYLALLPGVNYNYHSSVVTHDREENVLSIKILMGI